MSRLFEKAPIRLLALIVAMTVGAPRVALAATAQDFLNAPVWYVQYEVTLTSNYSGTIPVTAGSKSFTSSLLRVFSGSDKLNLRSQGPGAFSMLAMASGNSSGASQADAQKMATQMMAQMDVMANWMPGGASIDDSTASDEEVSASMMPMGPVSIDYTRIETGKDLVDELGAKFDMKKTTTMKGSGAVQVGGFGGVTLEMNTSDKSYLLTLPLGFNAQSAGTKMVTVDVTTYKGKADIENRSERDVPFDLFPSGVAIDTPPTGAPQGGFLIRGTFDPAAGKIVGEQTYPGHYADGGAAPATIVVKYVLTMTPPAKK